MLFLSESTRVEWHNVNFVNVYCRPTICFISTSKLTYLALAGLTNTVVKGKKKYNISPIYSIIVQKKIHVVYQSGLRSKRLKFL